VVCDRKTHIGGGVRLIADGITAGRVNAKRFTLWVQYLYSYRFPTTFKFPPRVQLRMA
jgi:hypothetical protein